MNPEIASLRALADARGFSLGAAVDMQALATEPLYRDVLARGFNTVVAENAFKQFAVWTGPYSYDFTETDRLAAFARDNGMELRGHTLVWHQCMPQWLREGEFSPDALRAMLRAYIHALVGRYRGQIRVWDVVNEAVADTDEDGDARDARGLRTRSFWYETLGPDYIPLAFQCAHEADPDARLYYNDYEIEDRGPKSDAVYALIGDLQAHNVPIHGIGMQGHLIVGWRAGDGHRANIGRFVDRGLEWQITEADIRMPLDGHAPSDAQLAEQAAGYADLARLCYREPGCRGLLFWGFTDAHSWIPGFRKGWGAALPLDAAYQPKPAWGAICDALQTL